MALTELPFSYADVTGVVDATAAPEIVVLIAAFKALLPDPSQVYTGVAPASPDFGQIPPATSKKLRDEIDALAAAIAAAPTA